MLARASWAGSQRFGAAVWSGDTSSTWEDLNQQFKAGLNMMMSGTTYWSVVRRRVSRLGRSTEDVLGVCQLTLKTPRLIGQPILVALGTGTRPILISENWLFDGFSGERSVSAAVFPITIKCTPSRTVCLTHESAQPLRVSCSGPLFRLHGDRSGPSWPAGGKGECGQTASNEIWSFGNESETAIAAVMKLRESIRPYVPIQGCLLHAPQRLSYSRLPICPCTVYSGMSWSSIKLQPRTELL
jgi:hypothetical protein